MHQFIPAAAAELERELSRRLPSAASAARQWLDVLTRGHSLGEYFKPDFGYPLFLLPDALLNQIGKNDDFLRCELTRSSVAGYLYIRLIDDVVDEEPHAHPSLLPLTAFFHHQFEKPYHSLFSPTHQFWEEFENCWYACQSHTITDSRLAAIDHQTFLSISSQKTSAAKIPLFAIVHHHGKEELGESYSQFAEVFSYFVQMADDLFDFPEDARRGNSSTYFLSEAQRRRRPTQSVIEWALEHGLNWAQSLCEEWLDQLDLMAKALASTDLSQLVAHRRLGFYTRVKALRTQLQSLSQLATDFRAVL